MMRASAWLASLAIVALVFADSARAQQRAQVVAWPTYANGYYAANYPAAYGAGPGYVVARPAAGPGAVTAYSGAYAVNANRYAAAYVPVTAAYANPTYFGAYNAPAARYRTPVAAGYYPAQTTTYYVPRGAVGYRAAPVAAYYAPQQVQVAPTTVQYAPSNAYTVAPAGSMTSGAEAYYNYGQPGPINYVPPRFTYRTAYAQVPVYMYRPVTVYDPITAQAVTCQKASTTSECQTTRSRWWSWLNPHSWHRTTCGTATCGTTGWGQPYYPAQPSIVVPGAPTTVIPAAPAPIITTPIPSAGSTVPPPPTRPFGSTFVPGTTAPSTTFPSTTVPADTRPSLNPGGTIITPAPGTRGGGSFQVEPGTGASGSFGSGSGYAPSIDPYSSGIQGSFQTDPHSGSTSGNVNGATTFGSGYSSGAAVIRDPSRRNTQQNENADRGPTLNPAIVPIPDPDANRQLPANRAPQLLDPRDKTAAAKPVQKGDDRWAVVPAVWPTRGSTPAYAPAQLHVPNANSTAVHAAEMYDDSGWRSAN